MDNNFDFALIGLETRDRRVYEALVEQPKASLRQIAATTGINRGSVYESIKQLMSAGLVGSIQSGKQQRFIATDPGNILELLRERQRQAKKAETEAERYIEQLSNHQAHTAVPSFAIYYEGDEGIAAILRDVLKTMRGSEDKHYYVLSSKRIRHYMYNNFANYTQQRIKENTEVSVIAVGEGGETDALSNRRWLPAGDNINCYTIIYGTKTALISLNEENLLTGIVVDNEGITNMQKLLFAKLWDKVCTPANS